MNSSNVYYLLALIISSIYLFHCVTAAKSSDTNSLSWKPTYSYKELNMNDDQTNDVAKEKSKSGDPKPADTSRPSTTKCKDGNDVCSSFKSTMDSYLATIEENIEAFQQLNKNVEEMMKKISEKSADCNEDDDTEDSSETTPTTTAKAVITKLNTPSNFKSQSSTPATTKKTTGAPVSRTDASTTTSQSSKSTGSSKLTKTTEPSDSDLNPVYRVYVGHEKDKATLHCDKEGQFIYIIDTYYGPTEVDECLTAGAPFSRKAGDRNDKVRSLCGHWTKSDCSFTIDSSNLGDICKGVPKKLRIAYYCSAPGVMGLRRKPFTKQ